MRRDIVWWLSCLYSYLSGIQVISISLSGRRSVAYRPHIVSQSDGSTRSRHYTFKLSDLAGLRQIWPASDRGRGGHVYVTASHMAPNFADTT